MNAALFSYLHGFANVSLSETEALVKTKAWLLGPLAAITGALLLACSDTSEGIEMRGDPNSTQYLTEAEAAADAAKPRFQGEVNGIFIALPYATVADKYKEPADLCQGALSHSSVDAAGDLAVNLDLPAQFTLDLQDLNTGVTLCANRPVVANWAYSFTNPPNGAHILISRGPARYAYAEAPRDRVKAVTIGGRKAVLIEPITANGFGSASQAIFPEPFGMTAISTANMPLPMLMEFATQVAIATK